MRSDWAISLIRAEMHAMSMTSTRSRRRSARRAVRLRRARRPAAGRSRRGEGGRRRHLLGAARVGPRLSASDEQQGPEHAVARASTRPPTTSRRGSRAPGWSRAGDDGTFRQHYELHETRVDTDAASIGIGDRRFTFGRDFAMRSLAAPVSGTLPGRLRRPRLGAARPGHRPVRGRGRPGQAGPRPRPARVAERRGRPADRPHASSTPQTPFVAAAERGAAGVLFITQATELVRWDELRGANTVRRELDPGVPSAYAALPITSVLLTPQVTEALLDGEALDGRGRSRAGRPGRVSAVVSAEEGGHDRSAAGRTHGPAARSTSWPCSRVPTRA